MSINCLSLHRVAYDTAARAFCAEAQYVNASGVQRRRVHWRGPFTAEFQRIAGGLQDAASRLAQVDFPDARV
ncbi:hypothetical protein [Gymnodinialimonas ceratoperidinii]|uniref:Uncharacterized protein n=1 Tax=Gymnodinialimonas ceratoperidinii TaxID=2856823 RepID=A0A8F6TXF2_9RHOB|nr:hypothetical protein [Gymnodinialimonas ceratoperidinii]QXT40228.1 hypothetical protein KYE46_02930 [Gymnodinialimonas ceratoperidinii]